uniref:Ig-like domain-containing protein n=1 Tax=Parastrongyloides trichosuri TaxID=131310 RepID=A0A0N4Z9E2_PARTI
MKVTLLLYAIFFSLIIVICGRTRKCFNENTNLHENDYVRAPKYCEGEVGDILEIDCYATEKDIDEDEDEESDSNNNDNKRIRWLLVEGEAQYNVSSEPSDLKKHSKIILKNITKVTKNVEIACYIGEEQTERKEDMLIIKINHDDKKIERRKKIKEMELRKEIVKYLLIIAVLFFLDTIFFIIFLVIFIKYKRLSSKERRKIRIRNALKDAERTLSDLDKMDKMKKTPGGHQHKTNRGQKTVSNRDAGPEQNMPPDQNVQQPPNMGPPPFKEPQQNNGPPFNMPPPPPPNMPPLPMPDIPPPPPNIPPPNFQTY